MNFCKQCGKEVGVRHKFCNSSCAAKYNNAHRIRKPWTEEQKAGIRKSRKQRYCKYCGKELKVGYICNSCRPYIKFTSFANRLGFQREVGQTLEEQYTLAINYLAELYESGESTLTLEQKFGIPKETIWYNLKKFKNTRTFSEANQVRVLQGRISNNFGGTVKCRHGWHRNWQGFDGFYRSSYELEYARELDRRQVPYRIEYLPVFTKYYDTQKNTIRVAKPDFYLPETNEIVEIKSTFTFNEQNMRDKFRAYRERGFKPKLILEGKEKEINF